MTPDSFSDGGKFNSLNKAKQRIEDMIDYGADIIDVGGSQQGQDQRLFLLKNELKRVKK